MKIISIVFCFLCSLLSPSLSAQEIKGRILDNQTAQPIPYATIIYGDNLGVISNDEGEFTIFTKELPDSLNIASLGYETLTISASKGAGDIFLKPQTVQLKEVFMINKNLSGREIFGKIKSAVKSNYDFSLTSKKFFYRKSIHQTINEFEIEVEESTIDGIDQNLIDQIIANTPKMGGSYNEVLGNFYGDYDNQKINIFKAANLFNSDATENLDKFTEELQRRFRESLKKDSYLKIRSGLIGVKVNSDDLAEDLRKSGLENDSTPLTAEEQNEILAKRKQSLHNNTEKNIKQMIGGMFWEDHITFNLFNKSNKYIFKVDGYAQIDGHRVYIVSFEPDKNIFGNYRADFRGRMYVNTVDYGIHRLDYENVKPVFKFGLFGVHTSEDVFTGKVIFSRGNNDKYYPKYVELLRGETLGIDRPIKIIEKNKVVPGRNKQNELDLELNFGVSTVDTYQFFIYDSQPILQIDFDSVVGSQNFQYKTFKKYNPEYWKGTNIVEPNTAIQELTTITP